MPPSVMVAVEVFELRESMEKQAADNAAYQAQLLQRIDEVSQSLNSRSEALVEALPDKVVAAMLKRIEVPGAKQLNNEDVEKLLHDAMAQQRKEMAQQRKEMSDAMQGLRDTILAGFAKGVPAAAAAVVEPEAAGAPPPGMWFAPIYQSFTWGGHQDRPIPEGFRFPSKSATAR